MKEYQNALKIMNELFAKDCQFSLATSKDNVPSIRIVDTFYDEGSFYIVTHAKSQKVKEINDNENVALCSKLYSFKGLAENIGHPLKLENQKIREKLIHAFQTWYFQHNDENDQSMCIVRVLLQKGFFYSQGIGYKVDFQAESAEVFPFNFEQVELP
ncbi:MAG: pyridoxamine 5-phosphate oxidase [Firmicutes bacterium HGW-Firmicutes-3]|jgi:general stress protein 26|nr:MAG: pyridoxamine 5-phosphate oxidase [Firmicutes bacterium HGW-Firmicutes-3]